MILTGDGNRKNTASICTRMKCVLSLIDLRRRVKKEPMSGDFLCVHTLPRVWSAELYLHVRALHARISQA